jgi:hypothetical protein
MGSGLFGMWTKADDRSREDALRLEQWEHDAQVTNLANAYTAEREDTAVQRRVADLKAAGLNPLLAAGSAAQSGPSQAISTKANESDPDRSVERVLDVLGLVNQMVGTVANASRTWADVQRTRSEIAESESRIGLNSANTEYITASTPARVELFEQQAAESRSRVEIAESLAPARLNLLNEQVAKTQIANDLARQANPYTVQLLAGRIIGQEVQNHLRSLQAKLTELNISGQEISNVLSTIRVNRDTVDLSRQQQDLAATQLAIEIKEYELAYARKFNVPVGSMPFGVLTKDANIVSRLIHGIITGGR